MIVDKIKFTLIGNTRGTKYIKNSFLLILFQILNLIISLVLIPITLGYLGVKEYGVWITLTTIIGWFAFFDIGLGHGLRNKYAEAKASNNLSDVKKYVSTAFFSLSLISLFIFIVFIVAFSFIDWTVILNAPSSLGPELKTLAFFIAGFFCLRFIVSIVNTLLTADQEPAISSLIGFFGQLLSLCVVYIVTRTTKSSLLYIGIALSASQLFPLVVAFVYFFTTRYKVILPSITNFSKSHVSSILSLGIRFFLIQITALIFFQANNIIIAHVCGLEDVTKYNIGYKYINILYTLFLSFLNPLWSASTDAYTRGDIDWIKNSVRRLTQLWELLIFGGGLMVLISPFVYKFWLHGTLTPNLTLLTLFVFYFIFLARSMMFRSFMNGVGKISLQFYVTFLQSIFHIPLAILLGKYFGLNGIILVLILWSFINSIWEQIQYKRIINKTARGIWNR